MVVSKDRKARVVMGLFEDKELPRQVSIKAQIECVERELKMRRRVYPRWVDDGKMSQAKADQEIARMAAVLLTLKQTGDN